MGHTSVEPQRSRSVTSFRQLTVLYIRIGLCVHSLRSGFQSVQRKYRKSFITLCVYMPLHSFHYDTVLLCWNQLNIFISNWCWQQLAVSSSCLRPALNDSIRRLSCNWRWAQVALQGGRCRQHLANLVTLVTAPIYHHTTRWLTWIVLTFNMCRSIVFCTSLRLKWDVLEIYLGHCYPIMHLRCLI